MAFFLKKGPAVLVVLAFLSSMAMAQAGPENICRKFPEELKKIQETVPEVKEVLEFTGSDAFSYALAANETYFNNAYWNILSNTKRVSFLFNPLDGRGLTVFVDKDNCILVYSNIVPWDQILLDIKRFREQVREEKST